MGYMLGPARNPAALLERLQLTMNADAAADGPRLWGCSSTPASTRSWPPMSGPASTTCTRCPGRTPGSSWWSGSARWPRRRSTGAGSSIRRCAG
ncbi:hypothetical protein GXW82_11305 [Streptacidiphilus sp. 4-A2]|nr:hypothetical protein [Streptacidiphilus sp. 4-A2]